MKKAVRFLALLFAVLMLAVSCDADTPDIGADTTPSETTPQEVISENAVLSADLSKYIVIRSADASTTVQAAAVKLKGILSSRWGETVKFFNDGDVPKPTEYEILVGDTNRPETAAFAKTLGGTHYGFTVIGRKVVILGSSFAGTAKAVEMFLAATEGKTADKTVYLTAEEGKLEKEPEEPRTLRIMSFNVLCANTSGRTGPVCSTIAELSPDSFGVQEATKSWIDILKSKLGKEYACVGLGRDGGSSGEHSAVFYKKDKYELIDSGTKWLSSTPDKVSKVPDAEYRRIVTYVVLRNKQNGYTYAHINTHLDHNSGAIRKQQLEYLFKALPSSVDGIPTFFTGDFNGGIGSTGYNYVVNTKGFKNAAQLAKTGDKYSHATFETGDVLDYIFVKNMNFTVDSYHVYDAKKLSDHYPIYVDVTY